MIRENDCFENGTFFKTYKKKGFVSFYGIMPHISCTVRQICKILKYYDHKHYKKERVLLTIRILKYLHIFQNNTIGLLVMHKYFYIFKTFDRKLGNIFR